ncbi:MAG: hypothetical protein ABSF65_00840 [Candidatus Bathyarchaeia archaeon]|jgi:hypothetical protein
MIEKKLILCGILAIAIGIATIAPLEYMMAAQSQVNAQTPGKPWFNVNMPYAYFTANATNNQNGISYGEGYYLGLNITTNPDAMKTLPNSRVEYYQIQVYSDKGSIENFTFVISANCIGTTNTYTSLNYAFANYFNSGDIAYGNLTDLSLPTKEWVFLPNFNGSLPSTNQPSWQSSTSYKLISKDQAISGISESFTNGLLIQGTNMTNGDPYLNHQLQQISNIQNAQKISIDISRIGYVTIDQNSTIATQADNSVIQHIELTPYQGGFLHNTVVPLDQLSQINLESPPFP